MERSAYSQTVCANASMSTPPEEAVLSLLPIVPASLNDEEIAFHTAAAMESVVSSVTTSVVPIMLPMA